MRLFVSKNLCLSIGEDQRQLVREAFAIMEDRCVSVFFFPVIDKLHRTPEGNMPFFVFSEYAVKQTSGAKQSDMASVQRSERSSAHVRLLMNQYAFRLAVRRRSQKQVLNFVEGNASVGENCGAGFRNWIACLSSIAKYGQFFLAGKPFQIALYFEQDRISRPFCPLSPGRQNHDLLKAHTFGRSKPVNTQIFEVIGQETSAGLEPRLWNNEDENAVRFEPAISVFKKDEFETLVATLA
jgi:hypothetical protein